MSIKPVCFHLSFSVCWENQLKEQCFVILVFALACIYAKHLLIEHLYLPLLSCCNPMKALATCIQFSKLIYQVTKEADKQFVIQFMLVILSMNLMTRWVTLCLHIQIVKVIIQIQIITNYNITVVNNSNMWLITKHILIELSCGMVKIVARTFDQ